jgi:hypothetical protein
MPFPCFTGTTRALRLPVARLASLRCLRLAIPPCADRSCLRSLDRRLLLKPGVFGSGDPHGRSFGGDDRASHVPGGSSCAYALLSDPGGTELARPVAARRCCPRSVHDEGSHKRVFRGSITRPLHSLSTLRHAGYPNATQDSLPSAGHALTGGVRTRWIPTKGFSSASYIASSFPELRDARTGTLLSCSRRIRCEMRRFRRVAAKLHGCPCIGGDGAGNSLSACPNVFPNVFQSTRRMTRPRWLSRRR